MKILGIDPGTRVSGYGIIEIQGNGYRAIDYGCIRPPTQYTLYDRYLVIHDSVKEIVEKFSPEVLVVETQYVQKNVQSAIKLGMARGAVIIAAARHLTVVEITPSQAKRAVVGNGNASKGQVQGMIQKLLNLPKPPPEDAADALALAICHGNKLGKCYV